MEKEEEAENGQVKAGQQTYTAAKAETSQYPSQSDEEEIFYDFQSFVKLMKDPRADPIVRYTRSFLHNFLTKRELWTTDEQSKLVNDFKLFVYDKMPAYEPFKSVDAAHLLNAQEGMEKLIMGKIYGKCFSPCLRSQLKFLDEGHKMDLEQDTLLADKRIEFRFIEPKNLEIPNAISSKLETFTKLSGKELSRINNYKAPRDKMVCVLNACRVIFGFLKHSKLENGGADAFVPMLIYAILKSDVESLISNVNYIERFRYCEFLRGESAYYLSSLQGAAAFITQMNVKSLNIEDEDDFVAKYDENQEATRLQRKSQPSPNPNKNSEVPREIFGPSPSDYILKPLDEATSSVISKVAGLFAQSPTPPAANSEDISPDEDLDIPRLAQEIEAKENARVLEELHAMFPDMDQELLRDVSAAKKYRIGACVDVLLTLSS